jgi:hypothetical protein
VGDRDRLEMMLRSPSLATERPRLAKQAEAILDLFRRQGGRATNTEMAAVALKYSSRISDLRSAGYVITCVSRDRKTGLCVYKLEEQQ